MREGDEWNVRIMDMNVPMNNPIHCDEQSTLPEEEEGSETQGAGAEDAKRKQKNQ